MQFLRVYCTRQRIWHAVKYGSVGLAGLGLNASLVWLTYNQLGLLEADQASGIVFVVCGLFSFFAHAFLTWRDARERKLLAAIALFLPVNWTAGLVNYAMFDLLTDFGANVATSYIGAMIVSVPVTYSWNAIVVFPRETMPKERVLRMWQKLVEWNKQN